MQLLLIHTRSFKIGLTNGRAMHSILEPDIFDKFYLYFDYSSIFLNLSFLILIDLLNLQRKSATNKGN